MRFYVLLLFLLHSFASVKCDEKDEEMVYNDPKSTSDWIDPHSMVDYDYSTKRKNPGDTTTVNQDEGNKHSTQNGPHAKADLEMLLKAPHKVIQACDYPHLKHLVRVLLEATSDVNPYTEIKLSPENRQILKRFLDDKANIHDLTEILIDNVTNKTLTDSLRENYFNSIMEHFGVVNLVLVAILMLLMAMVIIFEMKTRLTARQQFIYLMIVTFVASIPWEWCRLYKKEFASKQSMMMKNLEKHCHTDHELGFTESVRLWWLSSFTFQDSSCRKYQESLLVDPIWEVPPSMAVSVTITRFIAEPLEHIADATGKSFRALFKHLPWQWQPIMFLGCLIVVIMCLILLSGIRISTPLFQIGLGVDPAIANASLQRLENQMKEIMQQNAAIHNAEPQAIENVRDDNRLALEQHLHRVQAMNDRSQEQNGQLREMMQALNDRTQVQDGQLREIKEFLLRLRPVAEQARQAEAVEHQDGWEVVPQGASVVSEERPQQRHPVQTSDIDPVEEVGHTY